MKHFIASLLLCCSFITEVTAGNRYYNDNDWRSLPFIEMMATMMKVMNDIMAGNNSYSGLNTFPYSPAFMPLSPYGMNNYLTDFNNLPMSPNGMGNLPSNIKKTAQLPYDFQTGKNASNSMNNFWDPNALGKNSFSGNKPAMTDNSLNGIWQALSGDVIAIYKDNYFIWSDGLSRNLAGRLMLKGNILYAYIPASKVTLQFQFYKEPGQFIVRDKTSRVYTFKRLH